MATLRLQQPPPQQRQQDDRSDEHEQPELQQSSSMSSTSTCSRGSSQSSPLDSSSDSDIQPDLLEPHVIAPSPPLSDDDFHEQQLQQQQQHGPQQQQPWTREEQERFMAFFLPYIQGKRLSSAEIRLIRKEAKRMGVRSLHFVDRLLEDHNERVDAAAAMQNKQTIAAKDPSGSYDSTDEDGANIVAVASTPPRYKHKSKRLEEIEEVDETENIQAYFSRMASLKVGGHLPNLNTDAIASFVEADVSVINEDVIEVDLDVGFVNRSLSVELDPSYFMSLQQIESPSWDDMVERMRRDDDCYSNVSTTIDSRNRYEPLRSLRGHECDDEASHGDKSAATGDRAGDGLCDASSPHGKDTKHVTWDEGVVIKSASTTPKRPIRRSANCGHKAKRSTPKQQTGSDTVGCLVTPVVLRDDEPSAQRGHSSFGNETSVKANVAVISDDEGDWVAAVKESDPYSFEHDLDTWNRKKKFATYETRPKKNSVLTQTSFGVCNSGDCAQDESVCVELTLVNATTALSIKSVEAVEWLRMSSLQRSSRRRRWQRRRHIPVEVAAVMQNMWRRSYGIRTKAHTGYVGVDQYSLLESAAVVGCNRQHQLDLVPWEHRDVRQMFLQERSISFSTNWFGRLRKTRGHDKVPYPVSRPKSMEMPTEKIPSYHDDEYESSKGTYSYSCITNESKHSPVKTASLSATSDGELDDGDSQQSAGRVNHSAAKVQSSAKVRSEGKRSGKQPKTAQSFDSELESKLTDDEDVFPGVDYGSFSSRSFTDDSESSSPVLRNAFVEDDRDTSLFCGALEGDGVSGFLDSDTSMFAWSNVLLDRSRSDGRLDSAKGFDKYACSEDEGSASSSYSGSYYSDDGSETNDASSTGSYEDIPECGTLINVKPKLGERVSRVSPRHTSHLLRSRFRKKYFPRGSFPYDKK